MRLRSGFGVAEALVAALIVGLALVPLLQLMVSNAAAVRPRELDVAVANLASDLLERVAVKPRFPDPLRATLSGGATLETAQVGQIAREIAGGVPSDIVESVAAAGTRFEITVEAWRPGAGRQAHPLAASLETWTVKATWTDGRRQKTRMFVRVSAQG